MLTLPIWAFVIICVFAVFGFIVVILGIIDFFLTLAWDRKYRIPPKD